MLGEAHALRCGRELVSIGDHLMDVLRKCGEPAYIDERIEFKSSRLYHHPSLPYYNDIYGQVVVQEWTYNFGRQRFMQLLRFENNRLKRIQTLDYGY